MRPRVVCVGAGSLGATALAVLRRRVKVVAVADNDPAKQGGRFHGVPVVAPAQIAWRDLDGIVITSLYAQQIYAQLVGLGVPAERIHIYGSESGGQRPAFPWDAVLALGFAILASGALLAGFVGFLCAE